VLSLLCALRACPAFGGDLAGFLHFCVYLRRPASKFPILFSFPHKADKNGIVSVINMEMKRLSIFFLCELCASAVNLFFRLYKGIKNETLKKILKFSIHYRTIGYQNQVFF